MLAGIKDEQAGEYHSGRYRRIGGHVQGRTANGEIALGAAKSQAVPP